MEEDHVHCCIVLEGGATGFHMRPLGIDDSWSSLERAGLRPILLGRELLPARYSFGPAHALESER